jgi:thiamine biosynthesis lipoprotein ApbE
LLELPHDAAEAAVEAAFSAVATVHRLMSFHETDSDVSRLNRSAASHAVKVHDGTYQVLEATRDLYRRSGGMFDISVAPALQTLGLLQALPQLCARPRREREQQAPHTTPPRKSGAFCRCVCENRLRRHCQGFRRRLRCRGVA